MPHSSGGGSHGGGSHGGSHSSGSHGGRSGPRISKSSFPGGRRYSYYRHGKQRYFYADKNFKPGFKPLRLLIGIVYVPFLFMIFTQIKPALKIVPKNYNHNIVIKDEADVLDDEDDLYRELERFMDKTGVTPSVITVNNEKWDNYNSLEQYAYDRYLQEFDDEMHWLIVYSQPIEPDSEFNDWYFEGMQGDNTDPIVTEEMANNFNNMLFNELYSETDVATAIKTSFSHCTDEYSDSINFDEMLPVLFPLCFILFHAYFMLGLNELKYRKAVLADETDMGGERAIYDPTEKFKNSYQEYKNSLGNSGDRKSGAHVPLSDATHFGVDNRYDARNTETGKSTVCQYCGNTFASKYKRCPNCNAENPDYLG